MFHCLLHGIPYTESLLSSVFFPIIAQSPCRIPARQATTTAGEHSSPLLLLSAPAPAPIVYDQGFNASSSPLLHHQVSAHPEQQPTSAARTAATATDLLSRLHPHEADLDCQTSIQHPEHHRKLHIFAPISVNLTVFLQVSFVLLVFVCVAEIISDFRDDCSSILPVL